MSRHGNGFGFSLIEAAIVLGVVGLVIGGIWIAASSVFEKRKLDEAIDGINFVVSKTQNLFSLKNSEDIGENMITETLGQAGGLPGNWDAGGNFVNFPLGTSLGFGPINDHVFPRG